MGQQGIYERIKGRVEQLKGESQDRFFSEYLVRFDNCLIQEKHRLDLLETELDQNCRIYRQRVAAVNTAIGDQVPRTSAHPEAARTDAGGNAVVPPAGMPEESRMDALGSAAVMPGELRTDALGSAAGMPEESRTDALGNAAGMPEESRMDAAGMPEAARTDAGGNAAVPPAGMPEEPRTDRLGNVAVMPGAGRADAGENAELAGTRPATAMSETARNQSARVQNPAWQMAFPQMQPQPYRGAQAVSEAGKDHEFTIGIHVFGTIGVLFMLAALILLGVNYMSSLVWEMGLYVLGLLIWAVAEFVIGKKSPILSVIISSLGIGSLYVTTLVNFLYLHNFNGLAAILITTFITVLVLIVSRKKDAGILRIVCIGACMISFLLMDVLHRASDTELLIYMVMIVVVQLLSIFLPVKKWAYGIALGQMAGTAFFAWIFAWMFAISTISTRQVMELRALYVIGLVVFSMLIMELTVWRMPVEHTAWAKWICVAFGIGSLLLVWAYQRCTTGFWGFKEGTYYDLEIWIRLGVLAAIAVMGGVFFFLTRNKSYLRWMQGYFVAGAALLLFVIGSDERLNVTITLTILTVLYKLWAYWRKPLWTADAIITTCTALAALFCHDSVHGSLLLGVILLGILLMNHWQTYFEFILTATTVLFISMTVDNEQLLLPLVIAVMWMAALLFNCVKRFAGRGIAGFNATVLVMEVSCYLGLAFFQQFDSVVTYLILTVLGLGIILFTFQDRFFPEAEVWRGLAVAIFLTYMVLVTIFKFEYRITASILLMAVGLLGIVFGFRQTDRKLRIYGLVLCMMTCFKITLFDFRVQSLQRIILFFAAGAMALFISGIYALMEKKYNRANNGAQKSKTGLADIMQANDKSKTQGREQGR